MYRDSGRNCKNYGKRTAGLEKEVDLLYTEEEILFDLDLDLPRLKINNEPKLWRRKGAVF